MIRGLEEYIVMKVTLIPNTYYPKMGGAEIHVRTLAKYLKDNGVTVNILTRNIPGLSHSVEGVAVHGFPSLFGVYHSYMIHSVPLVDPALILSPFIKQCLFKDSIIHAHGHIATSLVPTKKLMRYPLVLTVHDYWPVCFHTGLVLPNKKICNLDNNCIKCLSPYMGKLSYLAQIMAKVTSLSLVNVDKFVAVSSFVKDMLVQGGIPSDRIEVIYNWINTDKIRWMTECTPKKSKSVLYVGKLTKYKGIDVLIDAASRIAKEVPDFQLRVVGTGPLRDVCEAKVRKMNLCKNIRFLGKVDEKTLYQEYRNAMLFVCPSTWPEPCATVLLEAMAYRLPIVASEVGGIPEIVQDMKNGLLFRPRDSYSLEKCVLKLINDENLCRVFGSKGRSLVEEKFSIKVQIPKLMKVYDSVT